MSPSEVHGGLKRAMAARLYDPQRQPDAMPHSANFSLWWTL